ncbi:Nitrogen permease regulator 3 [Mycoemilia scoparia]|uniref:Nitrogen permease regulator 3 n=1 Tax=Mycoemilia scoparia TaxID=417184 RepID=A0A9W8DQC5_9FUNG|nr:Nitrogen permease regulator 3 [Mycoemilia scoparia]
MKNSALIGIFLATYSPHGNKLPLTFPPALIDWVREPLPNQQSEQQAQAHQQSQGSGGTGGPQGISQQHSQRQITKKPLSRNCSQHNIGKGINSSVASTNVSPSIGSNQPHTGKDRPDTNNNPGSEQRESHTTGSNALRRSTRNEVEPYGGDSNANSRDLKAGADRHNEANSSDTVNIGKAKSATTSNTMYASPKTMAQRHTSPNNNETSDSGNPAGITYPEMVAMSAPVSPENHQRNVRIAARRQLFPVDGSQGTHIQPTNMSTISTTTATGTFVSAGAEQRKRRGGHSKSGSISISSMKQSESTGSPQAVDHLGPDRDEGGRTGRQGRHTKSISEDKISVGTISMNTSSGYQLPPLGKSPPSGAPGPVVMSSTGASIPLHNTERHSHHTASQRRKRRSSRSMTRPSSVFVHDQDTKMAISVSTSALAGQVMAQKDDVVTGKQDYREVSSTGYETATTLGSNPNGAPNSAAASPVPPVPPIPHRYASSTAVAASKNAQYPQQETGNTTNSNLNDVDAGDAINELSGVAVVNRPMPATVGQNKTKIHSPNYLDGSQATVGNPLVSQTNAPRPKLQTATSHYTAVETTSSYGPNTPGSVSGTPIITQPLTTSIEITHPPSYNVLNNASSSVPISDPRAYHHPTQPEHHSASYYQVHPQQPVPVPAPPPTQILSDSSVAHVNYNFHHNAGQQHHHPIHHHHHPQNTNKQKLLKPFTERPKTPERLEQKRTREYILSRNALKNSEKGKTGTQQQQQKQQQQQQQQEGTSQLQQQSSATKGVDTSYEEKWMSQTVKGYEIGMLATLFSPKPSQGDDRFQVCIDDLMFVGHPFRDDTTEPRHPMLMGSDLLNGDGSNNNSIKDAYSVVGDMQIDGQFGQFGNERPPFESQRRRRRQGSNVGTTPKDGSGSKYIGYTSKARSSIDGGDAQSVEMLTMISNAKNESEIDNINNNNSINNNQTLVTPVGYSSVVNSHSGTPIRQLSRSNSFENSRAETLKQSNGAATDSHSNLGKHRVKDNGVILPPAVNRENKHVVSAPPSVFGGSKNQYRYFAGRDDQNDGLDANRNEGITSRIIVGREGGGGGGGGGIGSAGSNRTNTNTMMVEPGGNVSALQRQQYRHQHPQQLTLNNTLLSYQGNNKAKEYEAMFHIVFMLDASISSASAEKLANVLYNSVVKRFTAALRWEQRYTDWIVKESMKIHKLNERAYKEDLSCKEYEEQLLEESTLAQDIASLYHGLRNGTMVNLRIHQRISVSFQIPRMPLMKRLNTMPNALVGSPKSALQDALKSSGRLSTVDFTYRMVTNGNGGPSENDNLYTGDSNNDKDHSYDGRQSPEMISVMPRQGTYGGSGVDSLKMLSRRDTFATIGTGVMNSRVSYSSLYGNVGAGSGVEGASRSRPASRGTGHRQYSHTTHDRFIQERQANETNMFYDDQQDLDTVQYSNPMPNDQCDGFDDFGTNDDDNRINDTLLCYQENTHIIGDPRFPLQLSGQDDGGYQYQQMQMMYKKQFSNIYPTIEPYHALLLLEDAETLLKRLPPNCSPTLVRLIKVVTPRRNLEKLHYDIDCSYAQLCRHVAHLVYWRMAKVISPISVRKTYVVSSDTDSSHIADIASDFNHEFKPHTLHKVLALLHPPATFHLAMSKYKDTITLKSPEFIPLKKQNSGGSGQSISNNISINITSKETKESPNANNNNTNGSGNEIIDTPTKTTIQPPERDKQLSMLTYLLRYGILTQMHSWPLLLVPTHIATNYSNGEFFEMVARRLQRINNLSDKFGENLYKPRKNAGRNPEKHDKYSTLTRSRLYANDEGGGNKRGRLSAVFKDLDITGSSSKIGGSGGKNSNGNNNAGNNQHDPTTSEMAATLETDRRADNKEGDVIDNENIKYKPGNLGHSDMDYDDDEEDEEDEDDKTEELIDPKLIERAAREYTTWKPTAGHSEASVLEKRYLEKMTASKKSTKLRNLLLGCSKFMDGTHNEEEIMFRLGLRNSVYEKFVSQLREYLVIPKHP